MKVKDVMTQDVGTCGPDDSLTAAAMVMWSADCGAVPIVDGQRKLVGIVTDRDICIAVATRDQRAKEIPLREVATASVRTCSVDDDIDAALETMRLFQVHRLPVIAADQSLAGIITTNDLLRRCDKHSWKKKQRISRKRVLLTLVGIGAARAAIAEALPIDHHEEPETDVSDAVPVPVLEQESDT